MTYATKSPWVIHYDGSSCNGCDIEVLAALCPGYDVERFGIINTGNPKHADIFLVTGSVNEQNIKVVQEIYCLLYTSCAATRLRAMRSFAASENLIPSIAFL